MGRKLNLKEGDKFGRLTLLKLIVETTNQGYKGLWRCDCGIEKHYTNSKIVSGHTNSCGCYRNDMRILINTKHGHSKKHNETPEYKIWQKMKDRCLNQNNPDFLHYGGRNITVCEKWLDFKNFIKDMGNRPSDKYSIERIDVNEGYNSINCEWILKSNQPKNRRTNIFVNINGTKMCLKDGCRYLNISYSKVLSNFRKLKILPNEIKLWN